jgi:hypothetical protein
MKVSPIPRNRFILLATPLLAVIVVTFYLLVGVAISEGTGSGLNIVIPVGLVLSYFGYVYLALRRASDMELPLIIPLLYFTAGIPTALISFLPFVHVALCIVPGVDHKTPSR